VDEPENPQREAALGPFKWSEPDLLDPVPVSTPAPERPAEAPPAGAPRRGARWFVIAVVAAVIGAAVGAGTVTVLDDDGTTSLNTFGPNRSVLARPRDIQGVLARVQPGVVAIRTEGFRSGTFFPQEGAGTGMVVSPDGEVLTNAHVVAGAQSIEVTLVGETEPRPADLVGADTASDVALLKIRGASDLPVVQLGDSSALKVGDSVVAIGNALGLPGRPTVTSGIVSALDRSIETLDGLIQTDAAINPGNSGGPLANAHGEVVGVNTAVIRGNVEGIGFAIAINRVKIIVEAIRDGDGVSRQPAFLGVQTVTLTDEVQGVAADHGAILVAVVPGSPADAAGLQEDDVVTRIGDAEVEGADDLVRAVRSHEPGDRVEVTFVRGDQTRTVTVELGTAPVQP
jgi:S1-C subfamily serine protease